MLLVSTACSSPGETATVVGQKTDALDASAWNASKWISAVDAQVVHGTNDGRAADGSSWFVSTVKNEKKVTSAKWMTAGLGVYELYLNGKPVGNEFLKPGFTHYAKTKRSFTYDVTDAFNAKAGAENVLSAQVTPGWWADKIITPGGYDGMIGKKCAFRGVLELTYSDGTKKLYGTDLDNWKAGIAGPVKHAAIFDGETYDARVPRGFNTPDKLSAPEENTEFAGEILPSDGAEVYLRNDIALAPVKAYVWKDIEGATEDEYGKVVVEREYSDGQEMTVSPGETLVVDFGQNCAGVPSFVFKAAEGTTLTCLPSELLNDGNGAKSRGMDGPEGSVHRENLRIPKTGMRLEYTFAPSEDFVVFYPHCTFFGYRLVSITADADVTIKSVKSIPVTSIAENLETGKISTGDDLINRLISNIYWGQLSNYLSVPTDCPQRNERLGWTADTQVFTETGTFFANTMKFFHKWMRDMRDSQSNLGGYPGVAPLAQYGDDMMRVGWADAGVIVPWTVWKQFGDTQIIEENWESMNKFINHVNDTKYDHETLAAENRNFQWADWLSYEPLESCGGGASSNGKLLPDAIKYWDYLSASYWVIDSEMMRDMAAATGRDGSIYQKMADDAKAYIKEQFLNADGTFKTAILNTMQTPALFALKNGIVEGNAKEGMIARLRDNFAQHGNCLQTGFLGTSILMPTLTENGMSDIAYELLFQRKNPSWLYSVDNGATTIWERWNSYMLDKGMGPKGMNSFNHYAYGCVGQWIWETVAGIAADSAVPGFKHIIMKPVPDKRLGHINAEYKSAAGVIKSAWKYDGDTWTWEFTIPEGATATVTLPGETESKEYEAGTYTVTK
ncbi:MAG: glycoside hydrolase family 78 protein [Bacteroidales bacterium]|nr:glycoside hydrolase family 78 protein [Bacteroidales bacterium]MCI2133100.1 glycoside hydrolase family 78 protein [Bacteroidales bacterium]